MEVIRLGIKLDDREEGEIVDDDFEDISDSSISVPIISGKSVSPKEHLPAISLSSVTDLEEPKCENKIHRRHKPARRKCHRKRRNTLRKPTCSDSDSDDYGGLDKRLQKQLKDAVRRDDTEDRHQNSLRTRLQGMTTLVDPDSCAEKNCEEKNEQKVSSDEGDSELAQLRLEALRTAVLNKFMHRKKRKVKAATEVLSDDTAKTDNSETNKENNQNTIENCSKKLCVEIPAQNLEHKAEIKNNIVETTPPEEDEDVLRALLLASMSKKITSGKEPKKPTGLLTNNGVKHIAPNGEKELVTKSIIRVNKNITSTKVQLPIVKPLVINLNGDSDSDDDLFNKTIKKTEDKVTKTQQKDLIIESSVEKFLKEQRAKVEAQLSPIPKCPIKPKNSSVILEKSSVKLLPKVKQLEYQKLLQKLKTAERKSRMRKLALKPNNGGKPLTFSSKKIIRTKLVHNKQVSALKLDPVPDMSNEVQILHKIFKDIQDPNTERLQIKEKYNILRPAIKRVNEASEDRRKKEEEYKRLIQEVEELKVKLANARKNFSVQVNNLVQQKDRIDKSMVMEQVQPAEVRKVQYTSTPIKNKSLIVSIETCLPNSTSNNKLPLPENTVAPTETGLKDSSVDTPLNPGDPNDIDRIYSLKKNFPKYVSPLDNVKRIATDDPFSIICPYDVDGNCRDPGCIFKHFSK